MAGAAPSAKPAPFYRPVDFVDTSILLAENALCVVVVGLMVIGSIPAIANVLAQLAGTQIPGASRVDDVLLNGTIWAAFLGASFATRDRRHLAIDAIGRLLPDSGRRAMVALTTTVGSVVAFALAVGIFGAVAEASVRDKMYQLTYVIPFGFGLIGTRLLLHGFHEFIAMIFGAEEAGASAAAASADEGEAKPPVDPDAKPPSAFSTATPQQVYVAMALLAALAAVMQRTAVGLIALPVCVVAILVLGLTLLLRRRAHGTLAPLVAAPLRVRATTGSAVWKEVGVGLVGTGAILAATLFAASHIEQIPIGWGIAFFALMALLGAPLFTFLGGLALFLWLHGTTDVAPAEVGSFFGTLVYYVRELLGKHPHPPLGRFYSTVEDVLGTHFARMSVLPTIPIFTLAGYLMSESKTPQRLVRLARAFLGWMPGGLAVVCILASAIFTVFSGASGITIVAIGGLLFPALIRDKYPERFSLGLVTTGGALGITFFPCLPLIVYGIVAGLQEPPPGMEKVDLQQLAKAGILPGLLIIVLLMIYAMFVGVWAKVPRSKLDLREAGAALWEAKYELLIPVVVVVGLKNLGPTQGAALTALYVLLIEVFVYKDISFGKDLPRIIPESMVLVGAIFVKICAATILTFFFVQAQTADKLFEALTCGAPAANCLAHHGDIFGSCREVVDSVYTPTRSGGLLDSPISFLIALNLFLLVVGMLMDIFSAIVILVPLLTGIAIAFKINPYHLGIVFLINLEIGYLMPPMGLNLFIAGFRFGKPVPQLYRVVLPFIGIFVAALLVTTYSHGLALWLLPGQEEPLGGHAALPSLDVCSDHPTPPGGGGGETGDGGAGGAAGADDCIDPRPGERFDDFSHRCLEGEAPGDVDAGPPAPVDPSAPISADCVDPRPGEPFPAFAARCHL